MGFYGGGLGKQMNDVPALFGYSALSIIIYSFHIGWFNRWILFTAKISYPLFLIHFMILILLRDFADAVNLPWTVLLLLPTLVICYAVSVLLDKFFGILISRLQGDSARQSVSSVSGGAKFNT
jgi:peptidoglycan/LPS O-acetylase OafA/YrhL